MKTLTDRKTGRGGKGDLRDTRHAQIERKEFESARAGAICKPEVVKSTRQ